MHFDKSFRSPVGADLSAPLEGSSAIQVKKHYRILDGATRVPGERALVTANVVETCTLLSRYRLARGIVFLPVGALPAASASSLYTSRKRYVSHPHHIQFYAESSIA